MCNARFSFKAPKDDQYAAFIQGKVCEYFQFSQVAREVIRGDQACHGHDVPRHCML